MVRYKLNTQVIGSYARQDSVLLYLEPSLYSSESIYLRVYSSEYNYYKIFTLAQFSYSGCIFRILRTEELGSSLLARLLSNLKIQGSNP